VQNKKALPIQRNPLTERNLQLESLQDFPDVPALPETMLFLELMVQEPVVDLREVSQLVLADLGATLQVLRLAAREYADGEGRPVRMEDCISDLGLLECLDAISRRTLPRDDSQHEIAELWAHAREIAHNAREIAKETADVNPEEAYLAGLMHVIGLLPLVLGWRKSGTADGLMVGLILAKRWGLPSCVAEFFSGIESAAYATHLPTIVREAHLRAAKTTIPCPLDVGRLTLLDGQDGAKVAKGSTTIH
jgi:HD-like signal output (HDOD) protein